MRLDYIETFNAELGMTIESAERVLEQKRLECERLERFILIARQIAAPEGVSLTQPAADVPAFLAPRTAELPDAVGSALGVDPADPL